MCVFREYGGYFPHARFREVLFTASFKPHLVGCLPLKIPDLSSVGSTRWVVALEEAYSAFQRALIGFWNLSLVLLD